MRFRMIFSVLAVVALSACGGGGGSTGNGSNSGGVSLSGAGQKGPFQAGAAVTATELNGDGSKTGNSVSAQVGKGGDFFLSGLGWSGATQIEVSGIYFNENSGSFAGHSRTLRAVVDASGSVDSNVNLYTHLLAARIRTLMGQGKALVDARQTAQGELQSLVGNGGAPGGLDLADAGEATDESDSANLLTFSAAVLKAGLSQAQIDAIAADFGDNGKIDGSATSGGKGKAQWQAVQQAEASNPGLLSTARGNLKSQYGTTAPGSGGPGFGWELSACGAAHLSTYPSICPGEQYQGNTASFSTPIRVFPDRPGFYDVSVNFSGSAAASWNLYGSYSAQGKLSNEVGNGDDDSRYGVAEDITQRYLRGGHVYYLDPYWGGSSPSDFTAYLGRVSEGASSAPVKLDVGASHTGRIGRLVPVSNVSYYRFTPPAGGVRTITVSDQGLFGSLWVGVYKDDNDDGVVATGYGNSITDVQETKVERARDEQETAGEKNRPNDVFAVRADLKGQATYFLVVESRLSNITSSRPAPGYDEVKISIQ